MGMGGRRRVRRGETKRAGGKEEEKSGAVRKGAKGEVPWVYEAVLI